MTREQAILAFIDELSPYQLHGFLLTLRGETLAEGSYAPFAADEMHRMYSVSKSVVSLAIGMLADDGALSLDDRICDHFPEWVDGSTPELLRQVTIRDMLRMATCYDRSMYTALGCSDWTRPFFTGQPSHVPGTLFSYDTSASQVMCALVEKLTGGDILSFMDRRLFQPIGMTGPRRWLRDGAGVSQGGTGLLMTLRDFSRLANFCMSDGMGLISGDYLREATGWQIATGERAAREERYGYGYQFWMMREGFSMYGLGGQMALCLPGEGLALCTTADMICDGAGVQPLYDAFFRHLKGIASLPSDPADAEALRRRLESLRVAPLEGATRAPVRIALTQQTLPFAGLEIAPRGVTFTMRSGDAFTLPCAAGAWERGVFPASQEACITSGAWRSGTRYELLCELCGDFNACMKLFVSLSGSRASVRVVSSLWEFQSGWSGQDWGNVM